MFLANSAAKQLSYCLLSTSKSLFKTYVCLSINRSMGYTCIVKLVRPAKCEHSLVSGQPPLKGQKSTKL